MEGDKVRNVKFLRDTPAFPTDEKTLLQVLSVGTVLLPGKDAAAQRRR